MEQGARNLLSLAGVKDSDIFIKRFAEMRYMGQAVEIYVPIPDGPLKSNSAKNLRASFNLAYEQLLSRTNVGYPVEALASLEEGFEETLTLHSLGLFPHLGISLKTNNCIESVMSLVAQYTDKVDCWKNSS